MAIKSASRRDYLKRVGMLAATASLPRLAEAVEPTSPKKRVLRIAQITDIHVQPELGAGEGFTQCLRHLHAQLDPADLIINTGDAVMDCLAHDSERVTLIWELWNKILSDENKLPIRHAIGNHDIWGYDKTSSKTTGTEAKWGKGIALAGYGLKTPYYSFNQAGWHFVALDTVQPDGDHYRTGLDDEQFAWLEKDLSATDPNTPILLFSHIPIIGVAPLLNNDAAVGGNFTVPGTKILFDNVKVKNLFKGHANIKLCISGHIHLVDQIEYLGITYICGGAVCGDYWKGIRNGECDAGYSLIDLYSDGTFDHEYVNYGWKFRNSPAQQ